MIRAKGGGHDDTNCADSWDAPGERKWKQDAVLEVHRDALINIVIFSHFLSKDRTYEKFYYFIFLICAKFQERYDQRFTR